VGLETLLLAENSAWVEKGESCITAIYRAYLV